jgi:REP element-mobilizing transposase RayT
MRARRHAPTQQTLRFPERGGKRPGAGRPPKGERAGVAHASRPALSGREPVHVTLRVRGDVARLRRRDGVRAARRALTVVLGREDFRVCQISIQANHIHLIVEAASAEALSSGIRGFAISFARTLNRLRGRRGPVWSDRYHAAPLRSPRQVRHAIGYVLNNWRRHGEDRGHRGPLDAFASGTSFDGWAGDPRPAPWRIRDEDWLPVVCPSSWLLTTGWRRHGLIAARERPGPRLERGRG